MPLIEETGPRTLKGKEEEFEGKTELALLQIKPIAQTYLETSKGLKFDKIQQKHRISLRV